MTNRILVIDDQQDIADALVRLLKTMKYGARAIYDGKQAEAVAIDYLPHLAFIDISMPGFDGYQTVAKIRANRQCAHVVLVALTGHADQEYKRRAYDAGYDLFVTKPMSVDTLKEVLTVIDPNDAELPARDVAHRLAEGWKHVAHVS